MTRILALVCVLAACAPLSFATERAPELRESVAKIFATFRAPDFQRPWTKQAPQEVTGTGFIIEGNRIITNAHVVEQSSRIYVQPPNSADKLRARVVGISQAMDLALIEITKDDEREEFHANHPALPLSTELPDIGSTVQAIGYPMGGEQVSITEGVVSRIEFTEYNMDSMGLRIQVDAALNHGNSGGPVILDGEVCGVVFSGIEFAENIGYVIPAQEVSLFLEDIEDGAYDGKPMPDRVMFQTCENPALRDFLGLSREQTGLVCSSVDEDIDTPIQKWDVLDKIGAYDIDNAGLVTRDDGLRLSWAYFILELEENGYVPVTVIRDGQEVTLQIPVSNEDNSVVPFMGNDYPEYFVAGPMVLTPVRREHFFVLPIGYGMIQGSPIGLRAADDQEFDGEEFVVLADSLLPHPIIKGYVANFNPTLKSINGEEVKSLAHAVELIRDNDEDELIFEFYERNQEVLVFDADEFELSTEEILEDNSIRNQGSDRFMELLED